MQRKEISFKGQTIYVGIDVHKTIWVVTVMTEVGNYEKKFSIPASPQKFFETLKKNYPDARYEAVYEAGFTGFSTYYHLKELGINCSIVNARHIKYVPGHKTDKKDSAWICKLLKAGLLKGSFVPGQAQRDLRDLTRYRRKLVQSESAEHNRLIRVLEDANLKLSSVFSNVTGKTCTMVIDEILKGNTDAAYLASLCTNGHLKHSQQEILEAVEGRFTGHHKFMLKRIRVSIDNLQKEIEALDEEIDRRVLPFADRVAQLAEIPGMGETSAKELLAEIGVDMSYFPTDAHLASWAGLCSGNNESAGKKKARTRTTGTKRRNR